MPRPSHTPRLDYSSYTWQRVQIMKILVMQIFSTLPSSHPSSGQISSSAPCSQTPLFCSSLSVRDEVSLPYRATGKIIILFMFMFFIADEKTEGSGPNGSKHYQNSISF
jgi:hypothetical protein